MKTIKLTEEQEKALPKRQMTHPRSPIMQFFRYEHLTDADLRTASMLCAELAELMELRLPPSAEKSAGLRKLLEAKDCFVRACFELQK